MNAYLLPAHYYGPGAKTPVTNHSGCIGDILSNKGPNGEVGCRFVPLDGVIIKVGVVVNNKHIELRVEMKMIIQFLLNHIITRGPWESDFQWTIHGATGGKCGTNITNTYDHKNKGSCGNRNNKVGQQLPRRASINDWLKNAEGGGYAGMTGHADVTATNSPLLHHRGKWGQHQLRMVLLDIVVIRDLE